MWTRNYYNLLTAMFIADDPGMSTSAPSSYQPPVRVRRLNGNYFEPNVMTNPQGAYSASLGRQMGCLMLDKLGATLITTNGQTNDYNMGILVGSGSTPASYEDYQLDELITSGITLVSTTGTLTETAFDNDTHIMTSKRSFTLNNSSGSNITISEIGLSIGCYSYNSSNHGFQTLVYREVLDSPVTLAPGESMILDIARSGIPYNYTPYPA